MNLIINLFLYPFGIAILCTAAGLAAVIMRKYRLAKILLAAGLAVIWVFSTAPVCRLLTRPLERQYPPPGNYPPAAAIVLLSGGSLPAVPPAGDPLITESGNRIIYAAKLFKQGLAPWLVVTGGRISSVKNYTVYYAQGDSTLLTGYLGVDPGKLICEEKSQNTHDQGKFTGEIFDQRGLKKEIILVTGATHMPRAVRVFKKQGFTVIPAPADFEASKGVALPIRAYFPSVTDLRGTQNALHEYYGLLEYKLRGWI